MPIAPQRSRVLLRQRVLKGPWLSSLGPLAAGVLRGANTQIGIGDYLAMSGGRFAAPSAGGAAAAAPVEAFRAWVDEAQGGAGGGGAPFFTRWDGAAQSLGARLQLGEQGDDEDTGTRGLKKDYVRDHPVAAYAPMKRDPAGAAWKSMARSATAAAVSVPAALLTYSAVAPPPGA